MMLTIVYMVVGANENVLKDRDSKHSWKNPMFANQINKKV